MDKTFWKSIADNDYQVPEGYDLLQLTEELLGYLGSPDSELRDDIAYTTFYQWINKHAFYDAELLRQMRDILLDNLMAGIRGSDPQTTLTRSFSALVLSLIVYRDIHESFLSEEEFDELVDSALRYLEAEQDLRGYEKGIGWIHAIAHTADLLRFIIRNKKTDGENHEYILQAIANKLTSPTEAVFVHDEDERLALTAMEIIKRGETDIEAIVAILFQLESWKKHNTSEQFQAAVHAPYHNIKNFLRSWYFQLTANEIPEKYQEGLPQILERAVRDYNF